MDRQEHYGGPSFHFPKSAGGFNSVELRHGYVGHDDVRIQPLRLLDHFETVVRYSHNIERRLQKLCHPLQKEGMIVRQQDTPTILRAFNLSDF